MVSIRARRSFILLAKYGVSLLLMYLLVRSDQLDLSAVNKLMTNGSLFIIVICCYAVGIVLIPAIRWWLLLKALGIEISWKKAIRFQWISLLFNAVLPWAGGDLVKTAYVVADSGVNQSARCFLAVVLDRSIGLCGLALLGAAAVSLNFPYFWNTRQELRVVLLLTYSICLAFCFILAFMYLARRKSRFFARILPSKVIRFISAMDNSGALRKRWRFLLSAIALSILIHLIVLINMYYIGALLFPKMMSFSNFASIYFPGAIMVLIPVTPYGLGVGHIIYNKLFLLFGLSYGATLFNIYVVAKIILSVTGLFPFLRGRKLFSTQVPQLSES